uniref:Uncharacterized protein n=1 Tax=Bombyx mori TaxID=7091 RepID=A0A8R2M9G6_BOMMO|nr:uncharacterized protein LOC101740397 isoform X2 [Bombyx mori]XP_037875790.1 uncharacterized protein LOC101740397 isoform X2 [Bombyx mori]
MPSEKDLIIDDNEDFENDLSDFQIKIKPDHLPEKIDEDEKIIIDWETTSVIKREDSLSTPRRIRRSKRSTRNAKLSVILRSSKRHINVI